jgi:hypothetical protein
MSAIWAQAGMTARPDILERPLGFMATQSDGASIDDLRWDGMRWTATCSNTTLPALARTGRWKPSALCAAKGCGPNRSERSG